MLVADATTLRPLVANGVWTYRGTASSGGANTTYASTVTHQASAMGAVTEAGTNQANLGSYQQVMSHRSGEVHVTTSVDLGNGQSQAVDQVELRSPVRVNDQITLFDAGGLDLGLDLDGDGINELLDVAIYSRVVGEEPVNLVSFPDARAVRVTTFVATRVRATRGQSGSDLSTLDTWYAPNVGVVRIDTNLPSNAGGRTVTSETLVSFDGVDRGVGFLPLQVAVSPAGVRQRFLVDAIGFDSHALIAARAGALASDGVALSRVDSRGRVVSTLSYGGIDASQARLVRVGDAARLVHLDNTGLVMRAFDSGGNATGAAPVVLKSGALAAMGTGERFTVAGAGNALWCVWFEPPASPSTQYTLMARPFDAAGQPLAPASVLVATSDPNTVTSILANGAPGRAIVSWTDGTSSFYALMEGTAAPTLHAPGVVYGSGGPLFPAATSSRSALMWVSSQPNASGQQPFGVTFDAAGDPWWSAASSGTMVGENESLALPWISEAVAVRPAPGGAATLDALVLDFGQLWPNDPALIVELVPGNRPLAVNPQAKLLARGAWPFFQPRLVSLSGHVLFMGEDTDGSVSITSAWRRP
jgi:hypothetical protein